MQRLAIDQQRLGVGAGDGLGGGEHALDRIGHIVRLIDHVGGIKTVARVALGLDQFVEHQEQLVRIDRSGIEIVVAVFGVVEVKAAELAEAVQSGDDLFDVDVRRVVAEVDQALGLGAQLLRRQDARSPVRDHRRIEGGLEHLVFEQHAPVVRQGRVDLVCAVEVAVERGPEVLLAGEISAVADPDGQGGRPELAADLDAFDVVGDRLVAHRLVGRGQAAVLVGMDLAGLVLKGVGIDRIEAQVQAFGLFAQGPVVADLVPGEMRRNPGRDPAKLLDHPAVLKLFVDIGGLTGDRELGEARPAAPRAPGRQGERKAAHLGLDSVDILAPPVQGAAKAVVLILHRRQQAGVVALDLVGRKRKTRHGRSP